MFAYRDKLGKATLSIAVALIWIYAWSCPDVAKTVTYRLEHIYPPLDINPLPRVDAVVVMGGAISGALPPRCYPDLLGTADRLWHAARLYHAGKAPKIVVSGVGFATSDGSVAMDFLADLGVPKQAILLEDKSHNTIQNAIYSKAFLKTHGLTNTLLVTSASHMPRSMAAFQHVGMDPIPVSTDVRGIQEVHGLRRYVPSAGALSMSSTAVKEYLGLIYYRFIYPPSREMGMDRTNSS